VQTGEVVFDERWAAIPGYTLAELSPLSIDTWNRLCVKEDLTRSEQLLKKHFKKESPIYECEVRMLHKDGHPVWVLDRGKVVEWDAEDRPVRMTGTHLDITERKRAEEAVLAANKKLNILNSVTRHDVLNQIQVLIMLLQIVEENTKDKETIEFVRKAEGATERITRQIDFTKEYQDIGIQAPQWQNAADIIRSAKSQLTECPYELLVDIDPVEIYADPLLLKVFYNLLENAIRHGEHVSTVRFFCYKSDDGLTLVCEDDGAGVDAESKKHLFRRGYGKHTGYGLYLMREILSISGITIKECGEPGKGARFEMTVPEGAFRTIGKRD
jgi:PAS domain S-box-containing protein